MSGEAEGDGLLGALGLRPGEAAEVLHQHWMARRARRAGGAGNGGPARLSRAATPAELRAVLRGYAARKAAFGELVRQGKLPPRPTD